MARELRIHERPTSLERPVLIGAFRGWNDGGQAATLAAGYLATALGSEEVRGHRPGALRRLPGDACRYVSLEEGRTRKIEWPENTFYRAQHPRRRSRCDPARRRRAELSLADVQRDRHRPRTRPRRRARGDARRARRGCAAHATRRRSRALRLTRSSSTSSGCSSRATRGPAAGRPRRGTSRRRTSGSRPPSPPATTARRAATTRPIANSDDIPSRNAAR